LRLSKYFIPTLKENPSESEIPSHALSLRAALIRKTASGVYSFLPLGFKVLKKIEEIIRQEMVKAGAIEVLLPVIQPATIWQKSERWYEYGPEMFRLQDRNKRDFCLGPTHEELITTMASLDLKSYKDLPINIFQIQVKFRDEIRPRYGLLRAREFIMKDAYSFCASEDELDQDYENMYKAYCAIIERMGLKYRIVEADTGLIGGKYSHEFLVLADNGEETLAYCDSCDYAANYENASYKTTSDFDKALMKGSDDFSGMENIKEVHTPNIKTIEELSKFLNIRPQDIVKTMALKDEESLLYLFILRGDRELNMTKAQKFIGKKLDLVSEEDFSDLPIGFLGPVMLNRQTKIYGDYSIYGLKNFAAGSNKKDYHLLGVNIDKDFKVDGWSDFSYPAEGDFCIKCGNILKYDKGIEVGHIFKLGTKYSERLQASFLDKDSQLKPFIMGCYGIGVSRMLAAAIEQCNDERGITWPKNLAPFAVELIITNASDPKLKQDSDRVYEMMLENNLDVLFDDRDLSAGFKFKDSDLIGIPVRVIMGKNYMQNNIIEIEYRDGSKKEEISASNMGLLLEKIKM
jgi:prolyl-tRNA synthetase